MVTEADVKDSLKLAVIIHNAMNKEGKLRKVYVTHTVLRALGYTADGSINAGSFIMKSEEMSLKISSRSGRAFLRVPLVESTPVEDIITCVRVVSKQVRIYGGGYCDSIQTLDKDEIDYAIKALGYGGPYKAPEFSGNSKRYTSDAVGRPEIRYRADLGVVYLTGKNEVFTDKDTALKPTVWRNAIDKKINQSYWDWLPRGVPLALHPQMLMNFLMYVGFLPSSENGLYGRIWGRDATFVEVIPHETFGAYARMVTR